jgi:hypothetical protein
MRIGTHSGDIVISGATIAIDTPVAPKTTV